MIISNIGNITMPRSIENGKYSVRFLSYSRSELYNNILEYMVDQTSERTIETINNG